MNNPKRIVIMAGGTGGHVFPALAVAKHLMLQGWNVSWLGTKQGLEARVIPENGIEIDFLTVSGVRGKGLFAKLKAIFLLFKACLQARKFLKQRQPHVVLGMGGFVAAPGGFMAKCLGVPLIIHEQNRVVGTTNRLLAKLATKVLEAFPHSFEAKLNAICTGNPLRADLQNFQSLDKTNDAFHILVMGGSQGAKILNKIVPQAIALIKNDTLEITHLSGVAMQNDVLKTYQEKNINAQVLAFSDNIVSLYQQADMIICRSGAMTVSEVAATGLPAIFVPLPHAIDNHQVENARYLTNQNAGILLFQHELTPEKLAQNILHVQQKTHIMRDMAKKLAKLNATQMVAEICIREAKK